MKKYLGIIGFLLVFVGITISAIELNPSNATNYSNC
jgi:uncharacterized membrane protein